MRDAVVRHLQSPPGELTCRIGTLSGFSETLRTWAERLAPQAADANLELTQTIERLTCSETAVQKAVARYNLERFVPAPRSTGLKPGATPGYVAGVCVPRRKRVLPNTQRQKLNAGAV